MESKRVVALWMLGGVLLGIAGLFVTYYLLTNELDLFQVTTAGENPPGLNCGTPLDHPEWDAEHPCYGTMNRQFGAAVVFGLASIGLAIVAVVTGVRRLFKRSEAAPVE